MDVNISLPSIDYIPLLLQLNLYSFEIQIDDAKDTVKVKNIDGTVTSHEMDVENIIYLIETGTLLTSPIPFMKNIEEAIDEMLEIEIHIIIKGIVEENWQVGRVLAEFNRINAEINARVIPDAINKTVISINSINNILGTKSDDYTYIYDITKLRKFIHCVFLMG